MGHRALVARELPTGRYDCYYAHWGGADLSLARRLDEADGSSSTVDPSVDPSVEDDPLVTDVHWEQVLREHLDLLTHEALFIVGTDGVDAYRPLWFGPIGGGVAVSVDPHRPCDDDRLLAWFQGTRDAVVDLIASGNLDCEAGERCLRRRIRAWADDRVVLVP